MKRSFCTPVFFFSFLLKFSSLPLVFCQLSPNQTATMITLASMLNNTSSPWNLDKNPAPCSWKGVNCSSDNSSVTALSLSGFAVSNSDFLPVICKIESLLSLDLSNNHLSSIPPGFFTACGGIEGLKLLNFSRNRIAGSLPTFVGFVGLESLDMAFNALTGIISVQLDGLVALKSLNLSFNNFSGSIPGNLGKALEELQLSASGFQGVIPPEIGSYQSLSLVDLSGNGLSGSIPGTLGNLSKLRVLILSENKLSDEIPANISSIPTLYRFVANQNQFSGPIPSGITRYLSFLDLSYNKLRGSIPSDFLSPLSLVFVDLSYNMLDGAIPETMSTSLVRLRLGSNLLNGSIPSPFPTLRKLTYLELDNNSLSSTIPTGLGLCPSLALLNLAQNKLTGPVPESLGNLSNLQVLKLQLNNLGGNIPVQITQLPKLWIMNISWNSLRGTIPPSISNLQALSHLNLQGNNLSGVIPDTIGTMNSLLELQLGENQLSAPIPWLPLNLQIALNLSSNLFQGSIPSTLSRLRDLEVLDLSSNKFTGGIPDFLAQMGSLTQLILSNNQLSGVIPMFKPFVYFNVTGNAGLISKTNANTRPGSVEKKKPVALAVILTVVVTALVAGVGMFVALLLSRRFLKVNDHESQPEEELPQVIQGNLLTANGIHRSNIDFSKAMEAVTDPLNIALKTRFCTYYKATMPSGASYFVKKLNWSDKIFQLGSHDRFGRELEVLGSLSNSNVMTPLAYVLTVDSAYLFYEHAHKGTLFHVLHGKLGDSLDWASRYSIAVGVAHGLTFLHGCTSGPILLLDLSSLNILLKSVKEPQVGDIELCKVIDPTKSTGSLSTVAGSVGYIPPEYAYTMRVTMAGNVYSFGVVLLELLTGKPAVSEGTELAKWVLSNSIQQHRLDRILDTNISRTSISVRSQMLALLKVAISCVSVSPGARPKMKSVLRMILNAR